jgi:hypothetical protein
VSLAWRALDARALRIAKVLISILDMHVSLRYCDQRVSLRAARKTGGGVRTVVTRSGFSSSLADVGARAPSVHRVRSAIATAGGESAWPEMQL